MIQRPQMQPDTDGCSAVAVLVVLFGLACWLTSWLTPVQAWRVAVGCAVLALLIQVGAAVYRWRWNWRHRDD